MTSFRQIILISLAILFALAGVACGATSPAATPIAGGNAPTPENTPTATTTSTPENTPTPAVTPTLEILLEQQRPSLPAPAMQGNIDVGGGHTLSYQCYGEGSPAVIVEAAAEDNPTVSLTWNAVVLGVLPTTRICIYDRANALTSQDVAENLHALLSKIPVPGPYILVAHSLGGWHARVFAHLYPEEVAGMVLVDTTSTYPQATIMIATAYPTYSPDEPASLTQNRIPEADISTGLLPSFDGLDMKASNEQVRQAGSLGDIPLVVISHTPGPNDLRGFDPAVQEQIGAIILKVMADQATLSSKGVFKVARTYDHFISLYDPQTIIDAILPMVEEIRNK